MRVVFETVVVVRQEVAVKTFRVLVVVIVIGSLVPVVAVTGSF